MEPSTSMPGRSSRNRSAGVVTIATWSLIAMLWVVPVALGLIPITVVLVRVGVLLGVAFGLVVSHELGHALVGKLLGYRVFELSIGAGPKLVDGTLGSTRFVLALVPLAGHTFVAPKSPRLLPAREVFVSLAGPAINVFTVAWAITGDLTSQVTSLVAVAGGIVVVANLVPRRVKNPLGIVQSDGLRALHGLDADEAAIEASLAARFVGEAYIRHRKGDHAGALTWDERGLVHHPSSAALEGDAATSLVLLHRYTEARDRFVRLLERDDLSEPQRALYENNLAWSDIMLDDPQLLSEALHASKHALGVLPDVPAMKGTRGHALILGGAVDEGVDLCRQAFRGNRSRESRAANACAMSIGTARQGRVEAATRHLRTAINLDPENELIERAAAEIRRADRSNPMRLRET
jgi:Peptidase family M50